MLVLTKLIRYIFKISQDDFTLNDRMVAYGSYKNEHYISIYYGANCNFWVLYNMVFDSRKEIMLTYHNINGRKYSFKFVEIYHNNDYGYNELSLIHPLGEMTIKLNNRIFTNEYYMLIQWAQLI